MPLHIDRVETQLDVRPTGENGTGRLAGDASQQASSRELREKLRPIVLEILHEELDKLRRQRG